MTCRIESWLRQHFPPEISDDVKEHFDIIPKVAAFDGISFGPRLNFLVGESGSGRTRLLERLKTSAGIIELPAPPPVSFTAMSHGQVVFTVGMLLVKSTTQKTALLVDDILFMLDDRLAEQFLVGVVASNKQAILTVTLGEMERAERLMRKAGVSGYGIVWQK